MTQRFDVALFRSPYGPPGEVRMAEARDVEAVAVVIAGTAPRTAPPQYLHQSWPGTRVEVTKKLGRERRGSSGGAGNPTLRASITS